MSKLFNTAETEEAIQVVADSLPRELGNYTLFLCFAKVDGGRWLMQGCEHRHEISLPDYIYCLEKLREKVNEDLHELKIRALKEAIDSLTDDDD